MRARRYLVEGVTPPPSAVEQTLVRLSCLEDDAEGEELELLWEKEVDAQRITEANWSKLAQGHFDDPRHFAAYYRTLRWNTVTSTDAKLFQAPYRAGIRVDAYQLEPLRKALLLPRVNLFIADDVGLGKTIEAGLIVRELLMRQRARRIVVAAPPSVVLQWKDELEQRFGLTFVVLDRAYVRRMRQERGFGVNPWRTHSRFIISHHLLRDEEYAAGLRDWLGTFAPQSLLILDEAHNAAPASGVRYAVDSQFTKSIREIAPLFEHRLFLSATPHNGHSNSFSALLEVLDPQRFCRGVPVESAKQLDAVMVRRLKDDLRRLEGGFPKREIVEVPIDGLAADDPELLLPQLLDEYRQARMARLKDAPKSVQNASGLVLCSLQKRLLSSIEAFARTLGVHRKAFEKAAKAQAEAPAKPHVSTSALRTLLDAPDADDERADAAEEDVETQEDAALEAATAGSFSASESPSGKGTDPYAAERDLLARMTEFAEIARGRTDARVARLIDWCLTNPDKRVLVFTEYSDTKRYLERQLRAALAGGNETDPRIATYHGGMSDDGREDVKRAFNTDPAKHPLRVLIATDAAREGVNLQNHCADLFHFDIPWNPSRLEQRNGRIDRKLQRAEEVRCHYFVYTQRPEDRVLQALVKKTKTIRQQLGSLAPVLERRLEERLASGFSRRDAGDLAGAIDNEEPDEARVRAVNDELEATRKRDKALIAEREELQDLLAKSRDWLSLTEGDLRDAISCSLELVGASPLEISPGAQTAGEFAIPANSKLLADPSWAHTLDTLRPPLQKGQPVWQWRQQHPVRPLVFADQGSLDARAVHLHLEHRFVQRLLGRFRSQGFVYDDLSRACIVLCDDAVPRVVLLGRLSLYGERAARLHDQILAVGARWTDASVRKDTLKAYAKDTLATTLSLLDASLRTNGTKPVPKEVRQRLSAGAERDLSELRPSLKTQASQVAEDAKARLAARAEKEAGEMRAILEAQRSRIQKTRAAREKQAEQLPLFADAERRQIEADTRYWHRRVDELTGELETEPERVRRAYGVKAERFEPLGLVYLWPITG